LNGAVLLKIFLLILWVQVSTKDCPETIHVKTFHVAKLAFPEGIQRWAITKWVNGHENFQHSFQKNASFRLTLPDSVQDGATRYKMTTANFAWLIQYAIDNNIHLRAMGNGWSFSEVAICEGGAVDTKALRLSFAFRDSFVSPDYLQSGKKSADLFFVQCGMSILQINEKLESNGRSLKASGASNGQSIAGATSTGTHGAAYRVGAVHDAIVGLHVVVGPTRHVWIEKKSNPIASDQFIQWLGAEKISDDDVFNAVVVSFGSFGFIHGVMLETEPIFLIEEHKSPEVTYDQSVVHALNTLDFSTIATQLPYPVDGPDKSLWHFEALVNPHDFEPDNPQKGIYIRTMYKTPYRTDYPKRIRDTKGFQYGDNTLGVIQTILDTLGSKISTVLVPKLVGTLLPLVFKPGPILYGTIGETFNNTRFRGKAASASIGMDISSVSKVVELMVNANRETPFPGVLSFRYVKGTSATLGFTRFPHTCVLEMDGVDSKISRDFYKKVWEKMEAENIPFTLHWGKLNFILDATLVRKMYGSAIDQWILCRHKLLDEATRKVFTNEFMVQCGLDG